MSGITPGSPAALKAADALTFAAAPAFGLMAWITANDPATMAHCASGSGILPIDGMTVMYLLMGLFHLSPWLRLASRRQGRTWSTVQGE